MKVIVVRDQSMTFLHFYFSRNKSFKIDYNLYIIIILTSELQSSKFKNLMKLKKILIIIIKMMNIKIKYNRAGFSNKPDFIVIFNYKKLNKLQK